MKKAVIFVSSSSDLTSTRQYLASELESWMRRNGVDDVIAPYLWEEEVGDGRMLSERASIQKQLRDPFAEDVPFTICMFGERCGVPLQDDLPPAWEKRVSSWRAEPDGRGLIHPWPNTPDAQDQAFNRGGFPLTGTVFELISAHAADDRHDNLVTAYIANEYVEDTTQADKLHFNAEKHWQHLKEGVESERDRNELRDEVYQPQIRALLNLLKYVARRFGPMPLYANEEALKKDILEIAKERMRRHFGFTSARNPFKSTLEHWTIDDALPLPGRNRLISDIMTSLKRASISGDKTLPLIKGRSGCGKSSVLHRGVLARSRERGSIVVPFRPLDLQDAAGTKDLLDMLWELICETVGGLHNLGVDSRIWRGRERKMAKSLIDILDRRNAHLVVGIDQFEEILDELRLSYRTRKKPKGWWLVMRFFQALSKSPRIQLIATLESSRWDTFKSLNIETFLRLRRDIHEADVRATDVAHIAEQGFARTGLPLDQSLVEEIKTKWEQFEAEHSKDGLSASPLPLACLWFSKVYDRFEDRAGKIRSAGDDHSISHKFASDAQPLSLDDLGDDGIAFDNMVASLADEAWVSTGQELLSEQVQEGTDAYSTLNNFLQPLIGLDEDGHKRLTAVPELGGDSTTSKLRASFRSVRLLVPASIHDTTTGTEGPKFLRLVHQSVIDRWAPAKYWFETRRDYLHIENMMRLEARHWFFTGKKKVRANHNKIQHSAQVLNENRLDWPGKTDNRLEKSDFELKTYALYLFSHAVNPAEVIKSSTGGKLFVHLAAIYHTVDLLKKFAKKDANCLRLSSQALKDNPLLNAAWSDGNAVPFLLKLGVPLISEGQQWSAIEPAIQTGSHQNYLAIIEHIDDVNDSIGPGETTMIQRAALYGDLFVLEDLLRRGADPDIMDQYIGSAIHYAAYAGNVDCFRRLLTAESAERVNAQIKSPICLAAEKGHVGIIHELLISDEISSDGLDRIISQKSVSEHTPIMQAALFKNPDVLRALLDVCQDLETHQTGDGKTLLHLAVMSVSDGKPGNELKVRARRTVEVLLDDGRSNPTVKDKYQQTAYDVADNFDDARRVLRDDPRVPREYEKLTESMRIADLTSSKIDRALSLLRAAPQALSEEHEHRTGLKILLDAKKVRVLTVALDEGLLADPQLTENANEIASLAAEPSADGMRNALIRRLAAIGDHGDFLPILLNAAIRDEKEGQVKALSKLGITNLRGRGVMAHTVFHTLAMVGNGEQFEKFANNYRFTLPLDAWNRRPSQLATAPLVGEFEQLEDKLFEPPIVEDTGLGRRSVKFHAFARDGDVKGFERQARGVKMPLPRDEEGQKPSQVAPEEEQDEFSRLEDKYFIKEN